MAVVDIGIVVVLECWVHVLAVGFAWINHMDKLG